MTRAGLTLSLIAFGILSIGALGIPDASGEEYKPKGKSTTLLQENLPGVDGKVVIIKRFEFPPGFVGGKHSHSGPVYVYIEEGEFTIEAEGVGQKSYSAGELYQEPIGRVMQGMNKSTTGPLKLVVFQVGDKGKPMMKKEE